MGGLTGAVHWWEEWQLRVLVLTSLFIQFFFLWFPFLRPLALRGWFRFMMWLAYHGGDAVAIYALATLFNRHKDEGVGGGSSSNTLLEVVWAPVLLIHLGGQEGVTAYNIEDNELWTRHLLTAVSQITVAVYVFCKSWPQGGDKRLLAAAILFFIVGAVKCFAKAWAFKKASIYSLVSSKKINDGSMMYDKLEEYVKDARDIVIRQQSEDHHQEVMEEEGPVTTTSGPWPTKRELAWIWRVTKDMMKDALASRGLSSSKDERAEARLKLRQQEEERLSEECGEASKLFVDLSSPYPRRIKIFEKFRGLGKERAYDSVQEGLSSAFFLLYTKLKTALPDNSNKDTGNESCWWDEIIRSVYAIRVFLLLSTFAVLNHYHKEAYNRIDVMVTYALIACTAGLEVYSSFILLVSANKGGVFRMLIRSHNWPETIAQYNLAGYFVRNKKHNIKMRIVSFLGCKDFVDQLWCMEPCFSSARITHLVRGYLEDGWKQKIEDVASYRSFNNHSSHWGLNMNRPFDECVLLWHLATDFCFFNTRSTSSSFLDHKCDFAEPPTRKKLTRVQGKGTSVANNTTSTTSRPQCSEKSAQCKAVQCRQMSNYMVYLLLVNPEMLLPGSRRNLFKTAYGQLKDILKDWNWNPARWSRCTPCGLGVKLIKEEAIVMRRLIEVMQKKTEKRASQEEPSKEVTAPEIAITIPQQNPERSSQEGSSMGGSNKEENFINKAWEIAKKLLDEKDEVERWEEIQDVWVQMLCFSASKCRGYLHAKALGKGGEFLSYVWLLLFYMGMETFSERLQRELLPKLPRELPQRHLSTTDSGGLHQRRHSTSF